MTATLANDSALITDFDADPALVGEPIQLLTAGDTCERMLLAPKETNSSITEDNGRAKIAKLSEKHNTLVIIPSDKAIATWSAYSTTIATKVNLTKVVASIRSKKHVGLVIAVNEYDGIDLPDDACRILVIDRLPQAFSGDERLESLMQRSLGGVDDRQVQRLEQGMGRVLRSNEGHCVVFLIGRRLAQLTVNPRTLERFSPSTQAQLKASHVMAKDLDNQPLSKIMDTAWQSLPVTPIG
ncbi:helicase C-terminal domain-containing protein [Glutamicibacter sp. AOP38-B1-38]|uniref:helicase C-terminal domain-containing protein n=1 Tax=Glutamicibacter sp. AOP38-B1-38 TaxID=3457680 RepID=UPI004034CB12